MTRLRLFLLLPMLLFTACPGPADAPAAVDRTLVGWVPYWDQENALASFRSHSELFDAVVLFWYYLDAQGAVRTYGPVLEDPFIVRDAHARGVKVFALIANLPDYEEGGDWDAARVQRVIGSADARAAHVRDLVALTVDGGFDGIDIDYEALPVELRDNFTQFIRELAAALHAEGKLLAVGLHPKTSEGNPEEDNGSHAQDWLQIATYADRLDLMAFGEHYAGSEPGSVASIPWLERVLSYAIDTVGVPPQKLLLEWPFYAVEWTEEADGTIVGNGEELTLRAAEALRVQEGAQLEWDDASQSPYFQYTRDGALRTVWFENARSIEAKLNLAERYKISSVGFWRLGGETEVAWPVFASFLTPSSTPPSRERD